MTFNGGIIINDLKLIRIDMHESLETLLNIHLFQHYSIQVNRPVLPVVMYANQIHWEDRLPSKLTMKPVQVGWLTLWTLQIIDIFFSVSYWSLLCLDCSAVLVDCLILGRSACVPSWQQNERKFFHPVNLIEISFEYQRVPNNYEHRVIWTFFLSVFSFVSCFETFRIVFLFSFYFAFFSVVLTEADDICSDRSAL